MSILDLLRINKDKRLVDEPPMSEEEFIRQTQPKIFNVIDKFYKDYTRPIGDSNLGIMNLVQAGRFFSNPTFTSGLFSPIGTLAIGGLRSLFSNIKDPYKSAFGNLNRQTREAINRDRIIDLQQRINKGEFGSNVPTPQDEARGSSGGGGAGNYGMPGRAATGYEDL